MINIIGNILGTSGYDVHTRQLANALNKLIKVRIDCAVPANLANQLNDQEVEMLKREVEDDQINLLITNPMHWRMNVGQRNWAYLIWEGDKIPKSWISECLNPDIEYIFVPSKHTKEAIVQTWEEPHPDIYDKIKIIPHGVDLNIFKPLENSTVLKFDSPQSQKSSDSSVLNESETAVDTFTFLCNKGFRNLEDRGGIQYAIKAYLEEFSKENVNLIVKLNPAYGIPDLNRLTEQIKPNKENLPQIKFDIATYKYEELVKLYTSADVFVSPTRAESFNIPCIEAMACGLPVITTNFGGQTDFCDQTTGWVIGGELKPVEHEIMYEETKWLTPDISELKQAMREAYDAKTSRKEKGKKALERAKEFTWENSAKKIVNLI